ncbi:MAG: DUF1292 domain-containing protein [Lachnospiraceae bacterium]|nr:DUF1292 domain-containing protein [Lachnospiraceae bacterium]
MTEKITFTVEETGEEVELYVVEETRISGVNYLLVTDSADETEDGEAYILKDVSDEADTDAIYEMVEDEEELNAVSKVFGELLEDITLE